jgi:enoyl-CoA hydratase/carnithine racemase
MAHESKYRDDIPWGPNARGPALEAIRQMQEEETEERLRYMAALIARLKGQDLRELPRAEQEQMDSSMITAADIAAM